MKDLKGFAAVQLHCLITVRIFEILRFAQDDTQYLTPPLFAQISGRNLYTNHSFCICTLQISVYNDSS
ncbi:MAG: hypothetical protein IJA67_05620 [Oscillospiraceae bacterium]|nr:hypothetical protein [Oscillospiraceae bacterium]